MIRTQIQLEEKQYRILKEMATEYKVSMATLIRQSVDLLLEQEVKPSRAELREKALSMIGIAEDIEGATDLSENHDQYLDEIYGYFKEKPMTEGAEDDTD